MGIAQDNAVIVCRVNAAGVMADSSAIVCMANSEMNLVDCHDIRQMTVGLALASDDAPIMHVCNRMGYMLMAREVLVNVQATDCIMLPDAIIQQTPDCVSWRQEGHLCNSQGSLSFFDNRGRRMLHLQLRKRSRLYYCNAAGGTATNVDCVYNK